MKVEVVNKPNHLGKSNEYWLEVQDEFNALKEGECLRIVDLTEREAKAVRQQAYRETKARSFQRREHGKSVLYLYRR